MATSHFLKITKALTVDCTLYVIQGVVGNVEHVVCSSLCSCITLEAISQHCNSCACLHMVAEVATTLQSPKLSVPFAFKKLNTAKCR